MLRILLSRTTTRPLRHFYIPRRNLKMSAEAALTHKDEVTGEMISKSYVCIPGVADVQVSSNVDKRSVKRSLLKLPRSLSLLKPPPLPSKRMSSMLRYVDSPNPRLTHRPSSTIEARSSKNSGSARIPILKFKVTQSIPAYVREWGAEGQVENGQHLDIKPVCQTGRPL